MKNGYRVIDIDTHVNPSLDTLVKFVDPSFRPRLDDLKPYIRTVGEYNALSIASIPFDRFPGEAPSGDDQAAVAGGRGALEGRESPGTRDTTASTRRRASAMRTPPAAWPTWTLRGVIST